MRFKIAIILLLLFPSLSYADYWKLTVVDNGPATPGWVNRIVTFNDCTGGLTQGTSWNGTPHSFTFSRTKHSSANGPVISTLPNYTTNLKPDYSLVVIGGCSPPECPAHAWYRNDPPGCICDDGYYKINGSSECSLPPPPCDTQLSYAQEQCGGSDKLKNFSCEQNINDDDKTITYDPSQYECYPPCDSPKIWNSETKECSAPQCEEGKVWDDEQNSCVDPPPPPECEDGKVWNGESCVDPPPPECPAGYKWDGSECVKDLPPDECGDGKVWNGNECVDEKKPPEEEECQPGQEKVDGVCKDIDENHNCPSGQHWTGSGCEKDSNTNNCPSGTVWDGTECKPSDGTGEIIDIISKNKITLLGRVQGEKKYGLKSYDLEPLQTAVENLESCEFIKGFKYLSNIADQLTSAGSAPIFNFQIYGETLTIDLSVFDNIASIIRTMISVLLWYGLIFVIVRQWRSI